MTRILAARAVHDALLPDNLSVREIGGNNRGPAVETYQHGVGIGPGDPWCAAHVHYRYQQASAETGVALPSGFPRSGYTPDYKDWALSQGILCP